jgi:hypothetical protein
MIIKNHNAKTYTYELHHVFWITISFQTYLLNGLKTNWILNRPKLSIVFVNGLAHFVFGDDFGRD